MAASIISRASTAQTALSHIDFKRLYRAFVSGPEGSYNSERTVFVDALSHENAVHKIARVVAALEFGTTPESVADRVYNCARADDLIEVGVSQDHVARLFETGVCGSQVTCWVEEPLFLMRAPAALIHVWARVVEGEK